ncbi:hypothetical protein LWI28_007444 [Acer negundo]|uniref:Fucosyltransferase n=1 Tax=Acer negundo TaxID=4023 RepID=A0AAD5IIQ6_ACENE|nr:hypothetical protein LWI28_007444 [Acer negundo]
MEKWLECTNQAMKSSKSLRIICTIWKAWAEINLLSMCDVLVTSGWSTFGYVAQGLGGLRPWILYKIENQSAAPDPPCGRVMSMEPCFHSPPIYDCKTKKYVDNGALVPHVRHCEDMSWGLKLFN